MFTYNLCVNYITRDTYKKFERKSVSLDEYGNQGIEETYKDVKKQELMELKVERLGRALEIISSEKKMILLLKYQDDVSVKELASLLNIGNSAVKMRLKRARAHVMKVYNENL